MVPSQSQPTNTAHGKRGGYRGRRGQKSADKRQQPPTESSPTEDSVPASSDDVNEAAICWICAEPVKYYSVSECDHRTCHVCALRLRALYKKTDCAFCKAPQASVIFTTTADDLFSSFTPDRIPYKDQRLSIYFETKEMMEETFILLRFNCPESTCDYSAPGWSDLKLHVRGIHSKMMCDLCIRNKHVFAHEHVLFTSNQLASHLPSMMRFRSHRPLPKEQTESPHPLCEFCHECFFEDDELFAHMREKHEDCFICKGNNIRDQYFLNYSSLEKHFHSSHHPCIHPHCLAQKFVVFNSALDLKAHMVEEHGAAMTSRDKKDVRRVQADFEFEDVSRNARVRRGGDSDREREVPPGSSSGIRPNGISRRREGFGATLTGEGRVAASNSQHVSSLPPHADRDPALSEKQLAFIARLQSLNLNSSTAQRAIEAAIQSFSVSESSARDLISTIWNISDQKLEDTAAVVNTAVDYLEEEDKKQGLLASWNSFKIEQRRQFPDLVPTEYGTGYAEITSGRVLNAKHLTTSHTSKQSSRQVWDRVAQAASSSPASIPTPKPPDRIKPIQPLVMPIPGPAPVPVFRQGQRNTPWVSSSTSGTRAFSAYPSLPSQDPRNKEPGPSLASRTSTQTPPPALSDKLFPGLPSSSPAKPKAVVKGNVSLRNILGDSPPVASVWGATGSAGDVSGDGDTATGDNKVAEGQGAGSGAAKKGKGKQKQTLFTLGTFPC